MIDPPATTATQPPRHTTPDRIGGFAACLAQANIDTDQIIPARYMTTISRFGLGQHLFRNWRYHPDGSPRADFVLNQPPWDRAAILLAGENFGCGSSREHAPWALADFGIRCVIAGSFGDLFRENCRRNGITLISPLSGHEDIAAACQRGEPLEINLARRVIVTPDAREHAFAFASGHEDYATRPLDEIARTLKFEAEIAAFEHRLEGPAR
ncbi:3-isopropylmalate dehydratase small subunit [Novosphingobium sp.]|uniref:3-isopropylmalate dehydratase small subunit n=1 Tax=Novosphingobium sp. TaxID=1874826 RepID=UPI002735D0AC|nr:3-isopropylmalate dehydratase small subunit [Novosphingobium sp.]MDP3908574.1 3-isopropylmalate dehydratase small subunit [Novosphingobium sp.]